MALRRSSRAPLAALCTALCAALLTTGGYGWADNRDRAGARGTNILVAGVDSREGLSYEETQRMHVGREGCDCTDVLMVVHLSENGDRASVVSIPRDSYVEFAPHNDPGGDGRRRTHRGKINAAYQHGGPELAVRTVEKATGLEIDHYLEADFTGFMRAIDDIGPAKVCTKEPLVDPYTDLHLEPGTHRLDGLGALRYVRTRHVGAFGDVSRVRRQQRLVADVVHQAAARGVFADEDKLRTLAGQLLASVRAKNTSVADLIELGYAARNLSMSGVEFATVPLADLFHWDPEWGSTVTWDERRAAALFTAMRRDEPLQPADDRSPPGGDWIGRVIPGKKLLCRP